MTSITNSVLTVPAADSASAIEHFASSLRYETDCWDVHDAFAKGEPGFVLLDVRGPNLFERGHVPGAINLPRGKIIASKLAQYPADTLSLPTVQAPIAMARRKPRLLWRNWGDQRKS